MIRIATIAQGDGSRIIEPRRALARTADEWRALWAAHHGPEGEPPAVDFGSRMVAAVFAGQRPSAGSSIEMTRAIEEGSGARIEWIERSPGAGMVSAQILTSPFHIGSLPRVDGQVRWAGPDDIPLAAQPLNAEPGAQPAAPSPMRPSNVVRSPNAASSTGLDPRTASALAYLVGPLSGALILLVENRNEDVRFHAWQSVIGLGALWLVGFSCYLLAFAALFVTATGVSWMLRLSTLVWVVWVIVWLVCLWKALAGERWKLPIAGAWAERYALTSAGGSAER